MSYVLIVSHGDRSGIQHAWGPYATEEDAANVWRWLQEIGIYGLEEILPLRNRMPLTRTEQLDRGSNLAGLLVGIGMPYDKVAEIIREAEEKITKSKGSEGSQR